MAGTTETQLREIISAMHLRHSFLGVFDNSFPGFININHKSSAIVNTGSRSSGGMHWIAFAYEPTSRTCYMFDPFGWQDSKLLSLYKFKYDNLIKKSALNSPTRCIKFVKSVESVQCPCSAACGLYACLFIASFDKYPFKPMNNNPIIDTVKGVKHSYMYSNEGISILHQNQLNMYRWFIVNNSYFRANKEILEDETALNTIPENHVIKL
ncbi:protease [Crane-associated adenovirus 1]|uniref:Protease n=1 Tax=Crane-associated adenovirus 1 TaxID=2559941 RepID=A0A5H2WTZ4_9ADEN|nr:protease [Crane-associated adenovirus 1]